MQRRPTAQAVISLIETLPPLDRKVVYEWLSKVDTLTENNKKAETNDDFWHKLSLQAMNQAWETEDEDIWDGIYQQQKENGKLQSV